MGSWRDIAAVLIVVAVVALALAVRCVDRRRGARGALVGGAESAPRYVVIQWDGPTTCYPHAMVDECLRFVRSLIRDTRNYGWASAGEWRRLGAEAARLSTAYGVGLTTERLAAMRDTEVALAARTGGVRAMRLGPALARGRRRGQSVLALAARHRLPPLAVLRQLLIEAGRTPGEIRALLAEPSRLPPDLAAEAAAAAEADLGSRANGERIRARAQAYEDAVGAHLRRLGLAFRTEAELRTRREAPPAEAGAASPAPLTPDFLLERPALIGGRPVHWIDAKNYAAVDSRLVAGSLARQAEKYGARFGPGAFVFAGGVMCDSLLARRGVLLLDGSHLATGG